ncbi:MAG: ArsR family transcriptional regulator [Methanoregula sp.]|nr:ArsR family transcriptional regulator [Methanoregula sp.]
MRAPASLRKKTGDPRQDDLPAIGLFSTPAGIRTVGSPVRVKILSVLSTRNLTFEEIVRISGRAKSTVSVHLKGLEQDGIIGSKTDPEDERKKIFFLRSHSLGNLSGGITVDEGVDLAGQLISGNDPFGFYRYMFRTIRVSLLSEGINIDPVLHESGNRVGRTIAANLTDESLPVLLEKLSDFWQKHKLGTLEVESLAPLTLKAYDCFECGDLPQLGRPACAFDSGILEVVFSEHFKKEQQVDETACFAMGDDHCRFVITPR